MKVFIVACVLFSVALAQSGEQTILKDCFEQDSISCVQSTVRNIITSLLRFRAFFFVGDFVGF